MRSSAGAWLGGWLTPPFNRLTDLLPAQSAGSTKELDVPNPDDIIASHRGKHQAAKPIIGALLRPGRVPRHGRFNRPVMINVVRFMRWRSAHARRRPDVLHQHLAASIAALAAAEGGATLRSTTDDVMALLLRMRRQRQLAALGAMRLQINARLAAGILKALRPAMLPGPNGAWRLNRWMFRMEGS